MSPDPRYSGTSREQLERALRHEGREPSDHPPKQPADLGTGVAHLSGWVMTRGKVVMAVFGAVGTLGSLIMGGLIGLMSLMHLPTPDEQATQKRKIDDTLELVRKVERNTDITQNTVGNWAPRIVTLEQESKTHTEQLAALPKRRTQ